MIFVPFQLERDTFLNEVFNHRLQLRESLIDHAPHQFLLVSFMAYQQFQILRGQCPCPFLSFCSFHSGCKGTTKNAWVS